MARPTGLGASARILCVRKRDIGMGACAWKVCRLARPAPGRLFLWPRRWQNSSPPVRYPFLIVVPTMCGVDGIVGVSSA